MSFISALCATLRRDILANLGGGFDDIIFGSDPSDVIGYRPGASVATVACTQLLKSIPKKFEDEIDRAQADAAAFKKLREVMDHVRRWDPAKTDCLGPYDEVVIGEFQKTLWDFFNPEGFPLFSEANILEHVDFGPGASAGASDTHFLTKLGCGELSAPNQLVIDLFDQWVRDSELRVDCEIARTLAHGSPTIAGPEEITAVPKTVKISRLVKKESPLGMFFQKGMQRVLEDRVLEYFGIDTSDQPALNAELARLGSIFLEFCTMDLESASDCLGLAMLDRNIPRSAMTWIRLLRSETAVVEGEVTMLPMMATMGNAFTFPMQIVIFASAVVAVYKSLGIPVIRNKREKFALGHRVAPGADQTSTSQVVNQWKELGYPLGSGSGVILDPITHQLLGIEEKVTPGNFGVFGDDIIVVKDAYNPMIRLLTYLGFRVNVEKSFGPDDGPFRESCGSDWYDGVNVRGVYAKSAKTEQDRCVLINSLVSWSARHGIILSETIAWLLSQTCRMEVPPWENPDSGIKVPLSCVTTPRVFRAIRPSKLKDGRHYQGSYLYKGYEPKEISERVGTESFSDVEAPVVEGQVNPSAILLAAVKGTLRGNRKTKRATRGRPTGYRSVVKVAPCWDYLDRKSPDYGHRLRWFVVAEGYFKEQVALE